MTNETNNTEYIDNLFTTVEVNIKLRETLHKFMKHSIEDMKTLLDLKISLVQDGNYTPTFAAKIVCTQQRLKEYTEYLIAVDKLLSAECPFN